MPTKIQDKCRQCSKLSVESAIARHGTEGDGCWVGELCHKRRTYYKKRDLYNRNRRLKYQGDKESVKQLESITIPSVPAVIVYFYRGRKDEPLHALSVELWVGQQRRATREPVHTLGWKEANVREYILSAIASFSQQYEVSISGVTATVELKPSLCPLEPCPLKVEEIN
ncbi:hypothetical protein [Synechocystis sp. PCC 7509]|uniref:hypothetical protein n=1 Tax=Synechocystis sp. PCC 7509 TaxID=927677 RepID=UPI0002ABFFCF|nr:hypothetical protein [Synechocystis sp. PCC 7509]